MNHENFIKAYDLFANYIDDETKVKKINTNTLILTGSDDPGSTVKMSKKLNKDIPNSKFIEIKGGKHLCSIECSDDVNIAIKKIILKMPELKKYKMFINGEWVDSESKKTFETLNPENNKPWAMVPEASAKDVDKAVKAAQKAFEGEWPKLFQEKEQNI